MYPWCRARAQILRARKLGQRGPAHRACQYARHTHESQKSPVARSRAQWSGGRYQRHRVPRRRLPPRVLRSRAQRRRSDATPQRSAPRPADGLAQEQKFQKARGHLGRSNQGSRGNRLQRGRAPTFEQPRQMCCHGPGDEPSCCENERQKKHLLIRLPAYRKACPARGMCGLCGNWQEQAIERKTNDEIKRRPDKAGLAPAQCIIQES